MRLSKLAVLFTAFMPSLVLAESYQSIETRIARMEQLHSQGKQESAEFNTLLDEVANSGQIPLIMIGDMLIANPEQPPQKYTDTLVKLAEQGRYIVQYELAFLYHYSDFRHIGHDGVPVRPNIIAKDDKKAVYWLQKSAKNNFAEAQMILGMLYENGDWGVKQDKKLAEQWYKKAAAQGLADAADKLAKMKNNE